MVRVIKNAKNNLHIWCDEERGGHKVYCNTAELLQLFIIRFQVKNSDTTLDFLQTFNELDDFLIEENGDWLTYYCKTEET